VKPGRYAAADGSFGRSAGGALGRGIVLLAIAMVIGIVLLNATDAAPPGAQVTTKGTTPAKSSGGSSGTTTTVAPTTTLPTHAPRDVKVIVANASSVPKVGATVSDALKPPGYNVLAPANAAAVKDSAVYFVPGYDRDAAAIAAALQFPATAVKPVPNPPPLADSKGANVVVIVGADQAPRFATATATTTTAKPAAGATTTTAKPAAGATTTTTAKPAATTTSTTKKP
jgi:hypothetical protein